MEHKIVVDQLKESYHQIFAQQSAAGVLSWAQMKNNSTDLVSPTIPFVGKDYPAQKTKVLLYASAENLYGRSGYKGHVDRDSDAIDRHRKWFDEYSEGLFFPNVHLEPMKNGSLLIVLRYICEQLGLDMPSTPREFEEAIAFANFGKFSIRTNKGNIDYAKPEDKPKLDCCLPYIKRDLEVLRPDIIVMPQSIYGVEREYIKAIKGDAKIVPIYQINTRVVNGKHISKNAQFPPKDVNELSPVIRDWYDARHFHDGGFTGKSYSNFLSVFTYLDSVLKSRKLIAL